MTALGTIIGRGVLGSRPAASIAGSLYYATDTLRWYRDNGSGWDDASGDPMTTSGDTIYGGSSGLPTRLPKGSDGQVLTLASGLPSWAAASGGGTSLNPGTSFPVSPATSDLCFRTDRGLLYYYDGTRWLTVNEYRADVFITDVLTPVTSTGTGDQVSVADAGANGAYVTRCATSTLVTATNNGSNYWTIQPQSMPASGANTNLGSAFDTSADTGSNRTRHTSTIGAVLTAGHTGYTFLFTRVGAGGGGIYLLGGAVWYRLIG